MPKSRIKHPEHDINLLGLFRDAQRQHSMLDSALNQIPPNALAVELGDALVDDDEPGVPAPASQPGRGRQGVVGRIEDGGLAAHFLADLERGAHLAGCACQSRPNLSLGGPRTAGALRRSHHQQARTAVARDT
jgi:hypothetical protein